MRWLVIGLGATSVAGWQPNVGTLRTQTAPGSAYRGQTHMQAYLQSHTRLRTTASGRASARLMSRGGDSGSGVGSSSGGVGGNAAAASLAGGVGVKSGRVRLPLALRSRSVLRRSNMHSSAASSESANDRSLEKQSRARLRQNLGGGSQAASSRTASYLESLPDSQADTQSGTQVESKTRRGVRWFEGLRQDWKKRWPLYKSDWTDGMVPKTVPAVLFLYFACMLPAVAFGGIANQVTGGAMGVIEYVIACGTGGIAFALFSGQPMTFIGPTGLTLAFISALASFTSVLNLPFLPMYAWVGVWTSAMLMTLSAAGACDLIDYATQFTDDVFNALLAVNFMFEALRSLARNFTRSPGHNKTAALVSLNLALATYAATITSIKVRDSTYFNRVLREIISDFGPVIVILSMGLITGLPAFQPLGIEFLNVPASLQLCNNRAWLVPMMTVPVKLRFLCALPAVLLTSLFYLDQNISSRVVNSPKNGMVKGDGYHIDLFVLGVITFVLSILGLPWQCAATVQSLNHVRAMTTTRRVMPGDEPTTATSPSTGSSGTEGDNEDCAVTAVAVAAATAAAVKHDGDVDATAVAAGTAAATAAKLAASSTTAGASAKQGPQSKAAEKAARMGTEEFVGITETRVTGASIHLAVLASLALLPVLRLIPMPVVSGIFLYLGRKVMSGNGFLNRIKDLVADQSLLPPTSSIKKLGYGVNLKYTLVQVGMLSLLWTLKSFKQTALFFPSVIGLLIIMRLAVLPKMFTKPQLNELDAAVG